MEFRKLLEKRAKQVGIKPQLLKRSINLDFSGGEKKKLEVLQLLILKPRYAILDETDSGLDIDALKTIAANIRQAVKNDVETTQANKPGILVITHYARLLKHLEPDFIHIMKTGKIVKTGGKELADSIERHGYAAD